MHAEGIFFGIWWLHACREGISWPWMAYACLQGMDAPPEKHLPWFDWYAPRMYMPLTRQQLPEDQPILSRMPRRLEVSQTSYHLNVLLQLSWRFQSLVNFIVALGILWCSVIFIHGIDIWQLKIKFVLFNSYIVKCCHWVVLQRHWPYFSLHFLRISFVCFLRTFFASLNAVAWNWNVKEWIQLALSSSSTSLRLFSFASSSHFTNKKPKPFVLTASHQKTDLSFLSSHLHDFQQAPIKSFSSQEPFTVVSSFVFLHLTDHMMQWNILYQTSFNQMLWETRRICFMIVSTKNLWKCEHKNVSQYRPFLLYLKNPCQWINERY